MQGIEQFFPENPENPDRYANPEAGLCRSANGFQRRSASPLYLFISARDRRAHGRDV